jgi:protein involved in temperature-dependent protein secretion
MTHAEALTAQNGLLMAIHCHLDDGGINEAGRDLFKARKSVEGGDAWTAEELAWLADMDSLYHAMCGSISHT